MLAPREFGFSDQLTISQDGAAWDDISAILMKNIPGAVSAYPAHPENDRRGIDWFVEMNYGHHLRVDCKVRAEDYGKDDLALETWSVVEKSVPGWSRDTSKHTDYVLWLWSDSRRWCLVPFPMLCAVFTENWEVWRTKFKHSLQKTTRSGGNGYHSECVFVPRKVLWGAIYNKYSSACIRLEEEV